MQSTEHDDKLRLSIDSRPLSLDVLGDGELRLVHLNYWGLSRVDKLCDFRDDIQRVSHHGNRCGIFLEEW